MNQTAMQRASEFIVGLVFGWGLLLSGMTDPGKVIGFGLAGAWDPSLALVMAGAIAVGFCLWHRQKAHQRNFWWCFATSAGQDMDRRLVLGSLVFGAGWGLAGFCPGPALVSMAAGQPKRWCLLLKPMLAGMLVVF